jgi:hypothetical protein
MEIHCENLHSVLSAMGILLPAAKQEPLRSAPLGSVIVSVDFHPGDWNDPRMMQMGVAILDSPPQDAGIISKFKAFESFRNYHFAINSSFRYEMADFRYGYTADCSDLNDILGHLRSVLPQDRPFIVVLRHKDGVDPKVTDFIARQPFFQDFVNVDPESPKKFWNMRYHRLKEIFKVAGVYYVIQDISCAGNTAHNILQATLQLAHRAFLNWTPFPDRDETFLLWALKDVAMRDTRRPSLDIEPVQQTEQEDDAWVWLTEEVSDEEEY